MKKMIAMFVAVAMVLCALPTVTLAASYTLQTTKSFGWDSTGNTQTSGMFVVSWNNDRATYVTFPIPAGLTLDVASQSAKATLSVNSALNNGAGGATTATILAVDGDALYNASLSGGATTTAALRAAKGAGTIVGTMATGTVNGTITSSTLDLTQVLADAIAAGKEYIGFYLTNREEDGHYAYGITTLTNPVLSLTVETSQTVTIRTETADGTQLLEPQSIHGLDAGSYTYDGEIPMRLDVDGAVYYYNEAASSRTVTLGSGLENTVRLVYTKAVEGAALHVTLNPTDDSYIAQGAATTNYGADGTILVTSSSGASPAGSNRDGLICFDLSQLNAGYLESAELELYVTNTTNDGNRTMTLFETDHNWSEGSVTWNNAPAVSGEALGTITAPNGASGWYRTTLDEGFLWSRDASQPLDLRMVNNTATFYFASKEDAARAPKLNVTFYIGTVEKANVTVRTQDEAGNALADDAVIANVRVGSDYTYKQTPEAFVLVGDTYYRYSEAKSTMTTAVTADGSNQITLVYDRMDDMESYQGELLLERGATCWFADPRAIRHVNEASGSDKTYVGAIDTDGTVKALQYNNVTGEKAEIILDTNFQADDHNNPTFLVLPDQRVMIFWSQHTAEPYFYYRVSNTPDNITDLGDEVRISVNGYGNYTYPSPFYLTDTPDSFYLCWRGVSWHPTIAKYSLPDANGAITCEIAPTQMVQSTGARPYAKYGSNGKDRIYFTYTTGHPDNEMPNWVYYNEIDVNTFDLYDVAGTKLANVLSVPYSVNKTNTSGPQVVDNPSNYRDWVWDIAKDADGNPIIAMVRISNGKDQHDYYYAKWDGTQWVKSFVGDGGRWFHSNSSGAEKCYSGGLALDHENPENLYVSIPTEGVFGTVYEIWKCVMNADGTIASQTQITENSLKNNVRPYVLPGSTEEDFIHLMWMNGDYYYWIVSDALPDAFPTSIMTDGAGHAKTPYTATFEPYASGDASVTATFTGRGDAVAIVALYSPAGTLCAVKTMPFAGKTQLTLQVELTEIEAGGTAQAMIWTPEQLQPLCASAGLTGLNPPA